MAAFTFIITDANGRQTTALEFFLTRIAAVISAKAKLPDGGQVAVGAGEGADLEWIGVWAIAEGRETWEPAE